MPWAFLLLARLCRPRDFRRDDADDHDRRPARGSGRPHLSETWLRRIYTVLLFVIAADLIRKLTI